MLNTAANFCTSFLHQEPIWKKIRSCLKIVLLFWHLRGLLVTCFCPKIFTWKGHISQRACGFRRTVIYCSIMADKHYLDCRMCLLTVENLKDVFYLDRTVYGDKGLPCTLIIVFVVRYIIFYKKINETIFQVYINIWNDSAEMMCYGLRVEYSPRVQCFQIYFVIW